MSYAKKGIYTISFDDNTPIDCVFRGNKIHDMGVLSGMPSSDSHGREVQGGNNNLIENNEIYNCGSGVTYYSFTDQKLTNTVIRYNYCHDMHQITSNGNGIEFNCNNDSLSDKNGNKAYFNIVLNCPGHRFQLQFEDQMEIYNSVVYNCGHSFWSNRSYSGQGKVDPTESATVSITVNTQSTYTLSISSATGAPASGQGGTTDPSPGNHSFSGGTAVQVKSIPNTDYKFSRWTGDISAVDIFRIDPTVTVDKNKAVSANFCTKCGDVNGDLNITPSDAQRAFDIYLGRISNPTDCEKENADVNCSGTKLEPKITPADAQAIFNKYLRKGELPSDCSGNSRAVALTLEKLSLPNLHLILNDVVIVPGEEVIVPVIVESPTEIAAFGFDLSFPREIFEFVRLERTEYSDNFVQTDANEITPGMLRVGGYKASPGTNSSSAVLVTLIFRVIGDTSEENSFSIVNSYDDLKSATIRNGIIRWKMSENERTFRKTMGKRIDE